MNNNEDREIQELMKEAPLGGQTPSKLKSKLQAAAVGPRVRHTSPWPARIAMAAVAGITVLAVGLSMAPSRAEAKSFGLVVNAANRLDAFQLVIHSTQGKDENISVGFVDGAFHLTTNEGIVMQIEGTQMSFYDPKKNELVEMDLGGVVDPKVVASQIKHGIERGMEEFDLKKMLADMEKEYGKENVEVGPIMHKFGRSMYQIKLEKPHGPERITMTVDADTDLPMRIQIDRDHGGVYEPDTQIELRLGNDIDPNLTKTTFPANAKKVHLDLGQMVSEGLGGEHNDAKNMAEGFKKLGEDLQRFGDHQNPPQVEEKSEAPAVR